MDKIRKHFKSADPVLYSYIKKIKLDLHLIPDNLFEDLCESIISQQLSIKASDTIFLRFMKLFKGEVTAQKILKMDKEKLRACGISWGKIEYLRDLASRVSKKELILEELKDLPDEEVIERLTAVKGIGKWTAEMFLMFALGRPDIFSHGDLGLKNAMKKIYKFKKEPTVKQIEKIVSKWSPYRTFACRVLWKSI